MTALPTLRLRSPVPFPASVMGTGGIKVTKVSGEWTVEPDFSVLATIAGTAVTDPSLKQIWIYDPATITYNVLTLGGLGDALYKLTSTSSITIGTGSQVFVTQANKDIGVGTWLLITSDAAPTTNYETAQVTAYSDTSLTVTVPTGGAIGSGTHTDWTIRPAGSVGATGATGATGSLVTAAAAGTADAITATYSPPNGSLTDKLVLAFVATAANATATPTFAPDGLTAHTIVKNGSSPLAIGDIPAALAVCIVEYNLANTRWVLLNPATYSLATANVVANLFFA